MQDLINITTNAQGARVVSARELHEFLGMNVAVFARWTKKNIEENPYAFEGVDWSMLNTMLSNGNSAKDYALSLDFAKRLSMMVRSEKGEEVRQYFIECEKVALQTISPAIPQTYAEALRLAANLTEEKERLETENKALAPRAEYANKVLMSQTELTTTKVAKSLGMSAVALNKKLCALKVQYKPVGSDTFLLRSPLDGMNYAHLRTYAYTDNKGKLHTKHYLVWTEKGRAYIHKRLNSALSYSLNSRVLTTNIA